LTSEDLDLILLPFVIPPDAFIGVDRALAAKFIVAARVVPEALHWASHILA
jgi:hypothetical protein